MKALRFSSLLIIAATFWTILGTGTVAHAQGGTPGNPSYTADSVVSSDGCFVYSPSDQTIQAYGATAIDTYTGPDASNLNPSCPSDVVIPDTLGGIPMLTIGQASFLNRSLFTPTLTTGITSLKLSANIQTIVEYSFLGNSITKLVIPSGVTSIGYNAFAANMLDNLVFSPGSHLTSLENNAFLANKLVSVVIPNSITSIGVTTFAAQNASGRTDYLKVIQGDQSAAATLIHNTWLVQISTQNGANPNNLQSSVYIQNENGTDMNNNGTTTDNFSLGGYLFNASSVTLNYLSSTDQALKQSVTLTGKLPDGTQLMNYLANDWQTWPAVVDAYNMTQAEIDAVNAVLAPYWHQGQTVTFTAPDIAGYVTPSPATRTMVLSASTTVVNFVYTQPASAQLASTGGDTLWIVALSSLCMFAGGALAIRHRKHSYRR